MPISELAVKISVTATDTKRTMDITYMIPANGAGGLALADPGKLKIGAAVVDLGTLVDTDRSPL